MSGIGTNPLSTRLQAQNWFKFQLERAPSLSFFAQKIQIPRISFAAPTMALPHGNIPLHGDHLIYEPLTVEFQVDENLENWLEIFNWMNVLTESRGDSSQYAQYRRLDVRPIQPTPFKLYSMLTVFMLDSQRNPTLAFKFHHSLPVELSGFEVESSVEGIQYVRSSVSFKYAYYTVETV